MPIRVELTDDAESDLDRLARSGMLKAFLAKLVKLEEDGAEVGRPLGRGLTNWRKITVGDRQWRIVWSGCHCERGKSVGGVWLSIVMEYGL